MIATRFWAAVDRIWLALGSVKITFLIFIGLLLLSVPGTIVLQENISNVDPGLQYGFDFWQWGQWTQLFTAYHSFWYVGLLALLAVNLIICSYERWPQMWKLAFAKPVALNRETIMRRPEAHRFEWDSSLSFDQIKDKLQSWTHKKWIRYTVHEEAPGLWQISWQKHHLSRLANYVVHTSLLLIFAGAIWSGLHGFEGVMNIPEGSAVDTFLMFKEGGATHLERPPGGRGLPNERMLDFRLEAATFNVEFYKDFPGRPKEFATLLNVIDRQTGQILQSKTIRVNDPLEYGRFTFYQASYGSLGDYKLDLRVIRKSSLVGKGKEALFEDQQYISTKLGQVQKATRMNAGKDVSFIPLRVVDDIQGHGPAVQFQEVRQELSKDPKANSTNEELVGEPFWVLKNDPTYDFERNADWALVVDDYKQLYFTGLQVADDPGAPIYWFGCFGMILGTFYALFFQHKKYHLLVNGKKVLLTGSTHRLPFSFETEIKKLNTELETELECLNPTRPLENSGGSHA